MHMLCRIRALLGVGLFLAAGCGGNRPPSTVEDEGAEMDAGTRRDTGSTGDGATDGPIVRDVYVAPPNDSSSDVTILPDGRIIDDETLAGMDGAIDAGRCGRVPLADDGGSDGGGDAGTRLDYCHAACGANQMRCPDMECPSGYLCLENGCGLHCVPAARGCMNDADCSAESTCATEGGIRLCRPRVPSVTVECSDSRDCPAGFFCEVRGGDHTCVDRRVACDPGITQCPEGYVCDNPHGGQPICVRAHERCVTGANCPGGESCSGMLIGSRVCGRIGSCSTVAMCGAMSTCAAGDDGATMCRRYGPCNFDTDCPVGTACVELTGEGGYGVHECADVRPTTLPFTWCEDQLQCDPGSICATPRGGGTRRCHTRPVLPLNVVL